MCNMLHAYNPACETHKNSVVAWAGILSEYGCNMQMLHADTLKTTVMNLVFCITPGAKGTIVHVRDEDDEAYLRAEIVKDDSCAGEVMSDVEELLNKGQSHLRTLQSKLEEVSENKANKADALRLAGIVTKPFEVDDDVNLERQFASPSYKAVRLTATNCLPLTAAHAHCGPASDEARCVMFGTVAAEVNTTLLAI